MKLGNDVFLFYEVAKFILKFAAEKASLKKLIDTGATVTIQIIAEDKAIDVAKLLT